MVTAVTHAKWPVREAARSLISLISSTVMVVMELIKCLCTMIVDVPSTVSVPSIVRTCIYMCIYYINYMVI